MKLSMLGTSYIKHHLKPVELQILLFLEEYTYETDVMLDNMLQMFLEEEMYEYCAIVRDEIERRNEKMQKLPRA